MAKVFYVDWARSIHGVAPDFGEEHFVDPNTATDAQLAAARTAFEEAVRTSILSSSHVTYKYYLDSGDGPGVDPSTLDPRHDTFVVVGHEHRNDYIDLSAPLADDDVEMLYHDGMAIPDAPDSPSSTRTDRIAGSTTDYIVSGTFDGNAYSYTFTFDVATRQYIITNTATGHVIDSTPDRIQYTLTADGKVLDANGAEVDAQVHYTHFVTHLALENDGTPIIIDFVDGALPAYADIAVALIEGLAGRPTTSYPPATSFAVERFVGDAGSGFTIRGHLSIDIRFTGIFDADSGTYTITDANGDSVATPTNPRAISDDTYTYTLYGITDGAGAEVDYPLNPVAISTTDFDATTSTTTIPNNGKPINFGVDISGGNAPAYAGIAIALIQGLSGSTATSYTVTGIAGQNPDDPLGFRITDNTNTILFEATATAQTLPLSPQQTQYIGYVYVLGDSDPVTPDEADGPDPDDVDYDAAETIRAVIPILPDGTLAERVALPLPVGDAVGDKFGGGARHVSGSKIEGRGGNDDITGTDGADIIYGDFEGVVEAVGDGNDYIRGLGGDDEIYGGSQGDYIFGGDGDDTIDAGNGYDYVDGGDGDDTIRGGNGEDVIVGGDGDDTINAGNDRDRVFGGDGDDLIEGGGFDDAVDIIYGEAGDDEIYIAAGGDNYLYGGTGDDIIRGGYHNDEIRGGLGNDRIIMERSGSNDAETLFIATATGTGDEIEYTIARPAGNTDPIPDVSNPAEIMVADVSDVEHKVIFIDGRFIDVDQLGFNSRLIEGGNLPDYIDTAVALIQELDLPKSTALTIKETRSGFEIISDVGADEVWGNGIKASYYTTAPGSGVLRLGKNEYSAKMLPDLVATTVIQTFYRSNGESFDVDSIHNRYPADLYSQVQIDALTEYWQSETDIDTFVLAFNFTVGSTDQIRKMVIKDFDPTDILEFDGDLADLRFATPDGNFYTTDYDPTVAYSTNTPSQDLRVTADGLDVTKQYVDIEYPVPHIQISHALGISVLDVSKITTTASAQDAILRQDDDDGIYYRDVINIDEYVYDPNLVPISAKSAFSDDPNYLDLRTPTEVDLGNSKTAYIYGFGGAAQPRYTDVAVAAIKAELLSTSYSEFHVVRDDSLGNNWKVIASASTEELSTGYNTPIITTLLTGTTTNTGITWSITNANGNAVTTPTSTPDIPRSSGDFVKLTSNADWTIGHWEFVNQYFATLDEKRQAYQEQSRTQLLTTIKIDADDVGGLAQTYDIIRHSGQPVPDLSNPTAITLTEYNAGLTHNSKPITIDGFDGTLPDYTDTAVAMVKALTAPAATSFTITGIAQANGAEGFRITNQDGKVLVTATASYTDNSDLDLDIFEWVEYDLDNGDKILELWLKDRYALDYETDNEYSVGIELTRGADTITDTIEINVNDLKETSDILAARTQIILSEDEFNLQSEVGYTVARKLADITHLGAELQPGHEYMVGNEELFEIKQNRDGGYELWLKGGVLTASIASHDSSVYVGEHVTGKPGDLPEYKDVAVYLIKSELVEGQTGFNAKSYHVETTADGFVITNARGDALFTGTESGATYTVIRNADNSAVDITSATIPTITHADGEAGPINIEVDETTGRPLPNAKLLHSYEIDFEQEVGAIAYDINRHFGEPVDVSNPDAITFADFEMDTSDGRPIRLGAVNGVIPDDEALTLAVALINSELVTDTSLDTETHFIVTINDIDGGINGGTDGKDFIVETSDTVVHLNARYDSATSTYNVTEGAGISVTKPTNPASITFADFVIPNGNKPISVATLAADGTLPDYVDTAVAVIKELSAPNTGSFTITGIPQQNGPDGFTITNDLGKTLVTATARQITETKTITLPTEQSTLDHTSVAEIEYDDGGATTVFDGKTYIASDSFSVTARDFTDGSDVEVIGYETVTVPRQVPVYSDDGNILISWKVVMVEALRPVYDKSTGNDVINGDSGDNVINGKSGNDLIYGREGDDTIDGGKGNDVIHGHDGDDTIYGGDRHDFIRGNKGNDILDGGKGRDVLMGGEGSDQLFGGDAGLNLDVLTGGEGNDYFYLDANHISSAGMAVVTDFSRTDGDKIRINVDDPSARAFTDSGDGSVAAALEAAGNFIFRTVENWEESVSEGANIVHKGQTHFRSAHTEFYNFNDGNPYVSSTNDENIADTIIYYGNGQKIAMVLEDFDDPLTGLYFETPGNFFDFV